METYDFAFPPFLPSALKELQWQITTLRKEKKLNYYWTEPSHTEIAEYAKQSKYHLEHCKDNFKITRIISIPFNGKSIIR